jgi:hypothetical protein
MAILLVVVVICILRFLAARAWRGYAQEYLKNPNGVGADALDLSPQIFLGDRASDQPTHSVDCTASHDAGCGHGSFDGGHSGFDGGGHH